jgi:hypothetical protein
LTATKKYRALGLQTSGGAFQFARIAGFFTFARRTLLLLWPRNRHRQVDGRRATPTVCGRGGRKPAEKIQLEFEPGLAKRILNNVGINRKPASEIRERPIGVKRSQPGSQHDCDPDVRDSDAFSGQIRASASFFVSAPTQLTITLRGFSQKRPDNILSCFG